LRTFSFVVAIICFGWSTGGHALMNMLRLERLDQCFKSFKILWAIDREVQLGEQTLEILDADSGLLDRGDPLLSRWIGVNELRQRVHEAFICANWNLFLLYMFLTPALIVDYSLDSNYAFINLSTDPAGAVSEVSGAAADSLAPSVLTLGFFRLGKSSAAGSSKRTSRLLISNILYICYFVSIELR